MLHGEIVAVGVLMQLHFNQTSERDINEVRALMVHMQLPTTLAQLGIEPNEEISGCW